MTTSGDGSGGGSPADTRQSRAYDPDLHQAGSPAADGRCSYHQRGGDAGACTGSAVVSYDTGDGWESGCSAALEELVEAGRIEPLGQGA